MDRIIGESGGRHDAIAATLGLGVALTLGACAMLQPSTSAWNPPPPGTTFTRVENNTGSFGTGSREVKVTVSERTWHGMDVVAYSTPHGTSLFSKSARLVAILNPADKPLVTWDPPEDGHGFRFPLTVGKAWTEKASMTMPNGKVVPHENSCKVEAREEVKVPVGTVMTFKVHCTSPRGLEITQWYDPESGLTVKQSQRRSANNPFGGAGTREDQVVSMAVKR